MLGNWLLLFNFVCVLLGVGLLLWGIKGVLFWVSFLLFKDRGGVLFGDFCLLLGLEGVLWGVLLSVVVCLFIFCIFGKLLIDLGVDFCWESFICFLFFKKLWWLVIVIRNNDNMFVKLWSWLRGGLFKRSIFVVSILNFCFFRSVEIKNVGNEIVSKICDSLGFWYD